MLQDTFPFNIYERNDLITSWSQYSTNHPQSWLWGQILAKKQ
jgi:hypothetical protein